MIGQREHMHFSIPSLLGIVMVFGWMRRMEKCAER